MRRASRQGALLGGCLFQLAAGIDQPAFGVRCLLRRAFDLHRECGDLLLGDAALFHKVGKLRLAAGKLLLNRGAVLPRTVGLDPQ